LITGWTLENYSGRRNRTCMLNRVFIDGWAYIIRRDASVIVCVPGVVHERFAFCKQRLENLAE